MRITVSARHCTIASALRDRARTVVQRLDQLTPFAQAARVVFDTESVRQTAEVRLRLSGGLMLVARAEAVDHRTALDRAEAKLRRQLERPVAKPRRAQAAGRARTRRS